MVKDLWARPWARDIAIFMAYGLLSFVFRELSVREWEILAGLRLAALLLCPYRYWPALVLGESFYYVYLAVDCASKWGVMWSLCVAPPPIVYVIPFVYWAKEKWSPVERQTVHAGRLLSCALIVSFVLMLRSMGLLSIMRLPAGFVVDYPTLATEYTLGSYLGILTVTPLALSVHQMMEGMSWRQLCSRVAGSRLLFESTCMVVPLLVFMFWVATIASPETQVRQIIQIAMFLPVLWLALRHGWQGAAVGGALASCVVMMLTPVHHDYDTFRAEAIVAFAISTMLLMGGRIAALDRSASKERTDFQMALALAQRNVYVGEMQLRMTSQALEQVREAVQAGFSLMMGRLRLLQPAVDERGYQRQISFAQDQLFRLADGLYPLALRERGLPNALREGTLARTLGEGGVKYECELQGPVSELSNALRMTIYRVIWEAVTHGCSKKDISAVRIRIRGLERGSRRGVFVSVYFFVDVAGSKFILWDEMLSNLIRASSGFSLQVIQDRAAVFEGYVKNRAFSSARVMGVYMLDPRESGGE